MGSTNDFFRNNSTTSKPDLTENYVYFKENAGKFNFPMNRIEKTKKKTMWKNVPIIKIYRCLLNLDSKLQITLRVLFSFGYHSSLLFFFFAHQTTSTTTSNM
jgi:hypothetical protein